MHNYNSSAGSLPPGARAYSWGTWYHVILPFLEQNNLSNSFNFSGCATGCAAVGTYDGYQNFTVAMTLINALQCPSDTSVRQTFGDNVASPNGYGTSFPGFVGANYVVNAGNTGTGLWQMPYPYGCTIGTAGCTPFLGGPFAWIPVGGYPIPPSAYSSVYQGTGSTTNFAAITDGLSNTLLSAEVIQGQPSADGNGGNDIRGFVQDGTACFFSGWLAPNSTLPDVINEDCSYPYANNPPASSVQRLCGTITQPGVATPAVSTPACAMAASSFSRTRSAL